MICLATSGCVFFKRERAPRSWPQPISAAQVEQFDGVFSNLGIDRTTGQPSARAGELFDFLTGQGHYHLKRGTRVEIRSSPDQKVMHIRQLDEQQLEIDSASLQRGTDFEFSKGFLKVYGPFSGLRADSGNLGTGVEHQSFRFYLSSTGDLLGKNAHSSSGLLFYFVPIMISGNDWRLWPKIPSE